MRYIKQLLHFIKFFYRYKSHMFNAVIYHTKLYLLLVDSNSQMVLFSLIDSKFWKTQSSAYYTAYALRGVGRTETALRWWFCLELSIDLSLRYTVSYSLCCTSGELHILNTGLEISTPGFFLDNRSMLRGHTPPLMQSVRVHGSLNCRILFTSNLIISQRGVQNSTCGKWKKKKTLKRNALEEVTHWNIHGQLALHINRRNFN